MIKNKHSRLKDCLELDVILFGRASRPSDYHGAPIAKISFAKSKKYDDLVTEEVSVDSETGDLQFRVFDPPITREEYEKRRAKEYC